MAADRFSPKIINVCKAGLGEVSRLAGAIIGPGNYGSFVGNSLVIPNGNVGTVFTFPKLVDGYLYIEVVIYGGIAGIYAMSPSPVFGIVGGFRTALGLTALGIKGAAYKMRLPYCGEISSLVFYLAGYNVREINVVYPTAFVTEGRDLTQCYISILGGGWIDDGLTYTRAVAAGASYNLTIALALLANSIPRVKIAVASQVTGLPLIVGGIIWGDGLYSLSYYSFKELTFCPDTFNGSAPSMDFTNNLTENVTLSVSPTVMNFVPVSSVYGTV